MWLRLEMRGYFASVRPECPHALRSAIEHGIDWHGRRFKFRSGPARRERIWFVKKAARAILEAGDGLVNDPEQPLPVSATRVQQLFGLTTAESMIAARCAAGVEPRDLAQELGISRLTLRTHLRSIFRKTGVKRQVELVILLLRSVAAAVADRT